MFKPALNITDQIADYLADQIIFGAYPGGDRIQEIKLAKALAVSRGSVREALLILERRHLIEVVPRKGAVVCKLSVADALEVIDLLAALEIRWYKTLARHEQRNSCLQAAQSALEAMELAARSNSVVDSLRARRDFYVALLAPAGDYMAALFATLLPTSQRIMCALVDQSNFDLHDIARYYRALFVSLQQADQARIVELVPAFGRRVCGLTQRLEKPIGSVPASFGITLQMPGGRLPADPEESSAMLEVAS